VARKGIRVGATGEPSHAGDTLGFGALRGLAVTQRRWVADAAAAGQRLRVGDIRLSCSARRTAARRLFTPSLV
jgi:hypothetical protein